MAVPARVYDLVERFDRNREAYLSNFNETQVRGDFIDPLLEELGWDVHNRQGHPEAYRQVIEEDKLKIGGGKHKAPDYGFYVGGTRKFFLEAKQPSVDIAGDLAPAVQLRRYAWSAQLPLSIVSDFEEFAFYDCRFEPQMTDKPSTARLDHITYDKYADRWDQIYSVFSYEAVRDGSLDKFAETTKRRRGTQTVDEAFLKEIEGWREALARDLASRNDLNRRQLNHAVQMIIDRIIFLRMAEDRGIEDYGRLSELTKGSNVYSRLCQLFIEADERYNSGLFHFREEKGRKNSDTFTLGLKVGDELFRRIIEGLYYPESPYEFGVLPEDVLGQVYERFLGKVIRLENGRKAVVEEKSEVRKAGGVYYTPTYIVDYVVEHTVGTLLENKTPEQASKLKIVDPACGSGSFLLGAYKYLLNWHCNRYLEDGSKKYLKKLYRGAGGRWMLTIDEKKRILLNNIHGVDIDPQAVEVTKLSLLLKVLEGESEQTLETQLRMFHERALPDLDNNIKNGNSLIGPDFYDSEQIELLDDEEHYRINVFDWETAFPQVFSDDAPGFDAVIGIPPYVLLQSLNLAPVFQYLSTKYSAARYKIDTYQVFIEQACRLARVTGVVGMITPNTFLRNKHSIALRKRLLESTEILSLRLYDYNVFSGASVDTAVTTLRKTKEPSSDHRVEVSRAASETEVSSAGQIPQSDWAKRDDLNFDLPGGRGAVHILEHMDASETRLGDFVTAYFGIQTHNRQIYVQSSPLGPSWKPALDGGNIGRYRLDAPQEFVCIEPDAIKSGGNAAVYEQERIGVRQIGRRPVATLLPKGWYSLNTIYNIYFTISVEYKLQYVLGLLSSNLLGWYWEQRYFDQKKTFPKIKKAPLLALPIPAIDFSEPEDVARHDRMVKLVERMLLLHKKLATAKVSQEKAVIQQQINATDRQIDRLVYELYGLSEEEIEIVEER